MRLNQYVYMDEANDTPAGGGAAETVTGGAGNDTLAGGGEKKEAPKMLDAIFGPGGEGNVGDGVQVPGEDKGVPAEKKEEKKDDPAAAAAASAAAKKPEEKSQPAPKAGEKKADPAQAKVEKKDPLHEMPAGLKKDAQERFTKLVEANKSVTTQLGEAQENLKKAEAQAQGAISVVNEFRSTFDSHHLTPDQFSGYLAFNKAVAEKDWGTVEKLLRQQVREVELASGKPFEMGNMLDDYPDLKKQVEEYKITEAAALEIARGRRQGQRTSAREEAERKASQEGEAAKTAVKNALAACDKLTKGWSDTDIDYPLKEPKLLAKIDHMVKTYRPDQWATVLKDWYDAIEVVKPSGGGAEPPPLRAGATPPPGAVKQASSMFEAMWGTEKPA